MADRLKGITIEIDGDTSSLSKALRSVNSEIRNTQNALKDVDKLLKIDPGNTELLAQKQRLLADAVDETSKKLNSLKEVAEKANDALANGTMTQEQYDALQREISDTENKLKDAEKAYKEFGSVGLQQIKNVGSQMQELGGQIEEVGKGLTKYVTGPLAALAGVSVAAFNDVDEGTDTIIKKTGATGDALKEMTDSMTNLATSIPTDFATAGTAIGEVNTRFGLTGKELEDLSAQFIKFADLNDTDVSSSIDNVQAAMAAFDVETESAGDVLDILNKAGQDTGVSVDKLAQDLTSNSAALQEMGLGLNSSAGFLAKLNKNGIDSSTVMAGLKKALVNATSEGKTMDEALAELQTSLETATSDTEAMQLATELFGTKAGPALALAVQDGRLAFDDFSNSVLDFGDNVDTTFEATIDPTDQLTTTMNELKEIGAELGSVFLEVIQPALDMGREAIDKVKEAWENLSPEQQEQIVQIGLIVAAIGPLLLIIGKVISVIGTLMSLAPMLGTVITALTGPIGIVIAIITALVAIGVTLYKNWDTIMEKASELWTKLKDTFERIKTAITTPIEAARDKVKEIIDKIKNFFNFTVSLPKIKLPHFTVKPSGWKVGDLLKGSIPKLSVEWYAKAMDEGIILDKPTIFGEQGGRLLAGGEAGREVVVGANSLQAMIREATSGLSHDINISVVVNGNVDNYDALAETIGQKLQQQMARQGRAFS